MEYTNQEKLLLEIASWCVEDDERSPRSANTHTENIKELVRGILKERIALCEQDTPELDKAIKRLEGK